jgi:hypothetical protein
MGLFAIVVLLVVILLVHVHLTKPTPKTLKKVGTQEKFVKTMGKGCYNKLLKVGGLKKMCKEYWSMCI